MSETKKALLSYEWHVISLIQHFQAFIKTHIHTHIYLKNENETNPRIECDLESRSWVSFSINIHLMYQHLT